MFNGKCYQFSPLKKFLFSFCFLFFGMWDISSPNQGSNPNPCIGRKSLNHWTTREFLLSFYEIKCQFSIFLKGFIP